MNYSMRQLLALVLIVGPAIGIALSTGRLGLWLGGMYVAVTLAVFFTATRTVKTWRTESVLRRTYGIALSALFVGIWLPLNGRCLGDFHDIALSALFVGVWLSLVANMVFSPTIRRTCLAANLQSDLAVDERYASVLVEYIELKSKFLRITGVLESEADFQALRKMIPHRNWSNLDGVYWHIKIKSPARDLDEWDDELMRI